MNNEAQTRLTIDELLKQSGWILIPSKYQSANVKVEVKNESGYADYILLDDKQNPIAVIEAKRYDKSPLDGKEQARNYAKSLNIEFVVLTNGEIHFLWNVQFGSPEKVDQLPTQASLICKRTWKPPYQKLSNIVIDEYFLIRLAEPNIDRILAGKTTEEKQQYLTVNNLKKLRYYQIEAIKATAINIRTQHKSRFLLEMATGTGKTTTTAAIIKLFLESGNATRVLFLVDRIELEEQAERSFKETVSVTNGYTVKIYKEDKHNWQQASILISTIQSFIIGDKYKEIFTPNTFDLVITDEAHRCIGKEGRKVFEYFNGYKIGLTATPKDYLRGVEIFTTQQSQAQKQSNLSYTQSNIEKRELLDTYMIFDCATYNHNSNIYDCEPSYKYDLLQGVKDKYLLMPKVIDARTEKTTKMLSEEGLEFAIIDEDGNEQTQNIKRQDFERKFFNESTNLAMCQTFMDHAKCDPCSGEVGKSIVFCVSQDHASRITQILNKLADKHYPNKYQSDFALQVTSNVMSAFNSGKKPHILFSENQLNGTTSPFLDNYKTSKTRICVTVAMMTTGYDCPDLLNVVLMRPIMSTIEFIQIKGRGTRKYNFEYEKLVHNKPLIEKKEKDEFYLIDFFANYEYFENKDYSEVRKIPLSIGKNTVDYDLDLESKAVIQDTDADNLSTIVKTDIGADGMKIDRELYKSWEETKVYADPQIAVFMSAGQYDDAESIIRERYENKSQEFMTLDKIERIEGVDYKLTWKDVLNKIFHKLMKYPTRDEKIKQYFLEFKQFAQLSREDHKEIESAFELYLKEEEFARYVDNSEFVNLEQFGFSMNMIKKIESHNGTVVNLN
jgi:type I restriction enzyme R subunit